MIEFSHLEVCAATLIVRNVPRQIARLLRRHARRNQTKLDKLLYMQLRTLADKELSFSGEEIEFETILEENRRFFGGVRRIRFW